jgi:hypothetical protein
MANSASLECPKCQTVNDATAERCDCGYDLRRVRNGGLIRAPGSGRRAFTDLAGRALWAITFLCTAFGTVNFVLTRAAHTDASAPQTAALAAEALATALLPYALSRAWDEVFPPWRG